MPRCIVCNEKPARIGKQHGYPQHMICSQRCAVNRFFEQAMDYEFCERCGEWLQNCDCPEGESDD